MKTLAKIYCTQKGVEYEYATIEDRSGTVVARYSDSPHSFTAKNLGNAVAAFSATLAGDLERKVIDEFKVKRIRK